MLHLSPEEMIARARGDLRIGAPVAVEVSDASAVVVAAETATQDRLDALWKIAADGLDIAVTRRRAETLKARAYDGDLARIALTETHRAGDAHAIADASDCAIDAAAMLRNS